jgi:hypothetical protein
VVMRWIANPCYSGSIPLPLFCSGRDGMVDMSGLDSGDFCCRMGSSPIVRKVKVYGVGFILVKFFFLT